jgi:hypothetical protein
MKDPNVIPTRDSNVDRPPGVGEDKTIASLVSDPSAKPTKIYIGAYKASSSCGTRPSKGRTGDAVLLERVRTQCEDCQQKRPRFGFQTEGKSRWCAACAKEHAGAVYLASKMCEDCQQKHPNFGLPAEGKKRRWCAACAKEHAGAVYLASKMCEGCQQKQPRFGLPAEGKKSRWCAGCAKGHAGAVDLASKMCTKLLYAANALLLTYM